MIHNWSGWERFPDVQRGADVKAPGGPGIYEVRHTLSGRVVAFGSASNVAQALSRLRLNGGIGTNIVQLFRRRPSTPRMLDLEYRTCTARNRKEARITARRLLGLRQAARRMHMNGGFPRYR